MKTETHEIATLNVDHSYQRRIGPKVKKIKERFNPDSFGYPVINIRPDGMKFTVDGQQRIEARRQMGHTTVEVEVLHLAGPREEAQVYLERNDPLNQRPWDKWRAAVCAELQPQMAITAFLEANGMRVVSSGCRPLGINFIVDLLNTWDRDSEATRRALLVQRTATDGGPLRGDCHMGMVWLLRRGVSLELHADKLRRAGMTKIEIGCAFYRKPMGRDRGAARAILDIINHGKRNKIPWPE